MPSNYYAMVEQLTLNNPLCNQNDAERDVEVTTIWFDLRNSGWYSPAEIVRSGLCDIEV